jgi:quinol monooxygenase YgiN
MGAGKQELGFVVIYRWKLKTGKEGAFLEAWRTVTEHLRRKHGGLGSRLHRADDGSWVAYAQWPDQKTWKQAEVTGGQARKARDVMKSSIKKRFDPVLLVPVADLLDDVVDPARGGDG